MAEQLSNGFVGTRRANTVLPPLRDELALGAGRPRTPTARRSPLPGREVDRARNLHIDVVTVRTVYVTVIGTRRRGPTRRLSGGGRAVAFFEDANEVYKYLGGVFRVANGTDGVGERLRAADIVLRLDYANPDSSLTVVLKEPAIEVIEGDSDRTPDVRMSMSADNGDKFWRGEYNVAVGLAKGQVKAKGPVTKILQLIPAAKPVFPLYRDLVAEKETHA
jgi:putative sterol carrier protein